MIAKRAARLAAGRHTPETSEDEEAEVDEPDSRQQQQPGVHFKLTPSVRTPVRPRTGRSGALKSTLKQPSKQCEMLTPAIPRTRRAVRAVNTEPVKRTRSCRSSPLCSSPPSCLPTPSDTAPPSPSPGSRRGGCCPVCGKLMLERSLARHLATVHRDIKPPDSAQSTPETGPSSGLRRGRKRSSPLLPEPQSHSLPRRLRSEDLSSTERLSPCPVCGTQLAKSVIPKHFQVGRHIIIVSATLELSNICSVRISTRPAPLAGLAVWPTWRRWPGTTSSRPSPGSASAQTPRRRSGISTVPAGLVSARRRSEILWQLSRKVSRCN